MFIVDGTMPEEDATAIATSVQSYISSKGTVLKVDPWGRRRMAYPINKKQDGYYWVVSFECEPSEVDALKQQLRVNENVIRWMVTRPEGKKASVRVESTPVQESVAEPEPVPEAGSASESSTSAEPDVTSAPEA
jgi:small subunit ribosomal protein S6